MTDWLTDELTTWLIFRHQNVKKCSEDYSFLTFWLPNVLFATAAYNFSTSKQTKVVQTCGVLYILTFKCAFRHSGGQFFDIWTDKSAPNMRCFVHFDLQMCFSPQRRAIFRHLNRQKWSRIVSFLAFSLPNVLFATVACNFSTSKQTKVVQTCGVLYILTFKCAFRHSGVQFFDIWTDKSAPNMRCFVHFDLQMCFSPQRRAIFRHLNRQKWSRIVSFLAFSLPNVLFATVACNFSTSEQTKVVQTCGVLYIFTSKCAFRHSGVQFLTSPLSTDLRTRRFNRPTFRLTRHTNLWKNTAFCDFSNIWRGCIFFLLTFWLLHLLSTDLTTLLLLFNSPYCRKFLFKLPSINIYLCIFAYFCAGITWGFLFIPHVAGWMPASKWKSCALPTVMLWVKHNPPATRSLFHNRSRWCLFLAKNWMTQE